MPFILDIECDFPENYYNQDRLTAALCDSWSDKIRNKSRVELIHKNVEVAKRHIACSLSDHFKLSNFDERNNKFIDVATDLAHSSILKILNKHDLSPDQVRSLWSNTVTGFAIPSIEARVMNKINFLPSTKRIPLMGLGCMAGVAGINRVADYLKGHPDEAAIFFSVELCSLTFQKSDMSAANLISTGLFGDGAAAVLMVGDSHPLATRSHLKWEDSQSIFFPDSQDAMGWSVGSHGLKIILNKNVPNVALENLPKPLNEFYKAKGISHKDITTYMAHPGGPKVIQALENVFQLPDRSLKHSWDSLSENGNMSSVSVLDIMRRSIQSRSNERTGDLALALAMGPAFSAELGLFSWN